MKVDPAWAHRAIVRYPPDEPGRTVGYCCGPFPSSAPKPQVVKESHPVYKKHAEQLSNAMDWFHQTYGTKSSATPVRPRWPMFDKKAAIPTGCRVVTKEKLAALHDAIHTHSTALADADTFRDATGVGRLLASLGLTASDFTSRYTSSALRDS